MRLPSFLLFAFTTGTLCLSGQALFTLPELTQPVFMTIDRDRLLVVQPGEVMVFSYDIGQGKLLASFCRKGEGPGEMKRTPFLSLQEGEYTLYFRGKLCHFDRNGDFLREKRVDPMWVKVIPAGRNYLAVRRHFDVQTTLSELEFILLNPDFTPKKSLYKGRWDVNSGTAQGFDAFNMVAHCLGALAWGDRVFIADSTNGFRLLVFQGTEGRLLSDKTHAFEQVVIDQAFKNHLTEAYRIEEAEVWPLIRHVIRFYDHFPAIRSMGVSAHGPYLTTYRTRGTAHELLTLSADGSPSDSFFLPLPSWNIMPRLGANIDLFTLHQGMIYELREDDETGIYTLHGTPVPLSSEF